MIATFVSTMRMKSCRCSGVYEERDLLGRIFFARKCVSLLRMHP